MQTMSFIPYSPPLIGEEEIQEVVDTLRSDWITTGPRTRQFEQDFAAYVHGPSALAFNSCTAALHTTLVASGIGPGAEVITTPMTFCATVNVIEQVGARPVLVDIEPDTLNIDPQRVADAITPQTKALIPVHYAGHPVDLTPLRKLARRHNLLLLEDAAHALPATYQGKMIGAGNNPVAFSFYATKNLTTGEGGMLTGTPEFLDRARIVMLHGMSRDAWNRYDAGGSWYYEVVMPGFKCNMMDIQAALGIWQLRKLHDFHARRQAVAAAYTEAFRDIDTLEVPACRPDVGHAWHLYVLRLRPELLSISRNHFIEALTEKGIGTSVHFIPIHMHPFYRDKYGYQPSDFPVTYTNYLRLLSLPLNARISDAEVERVIDAVLSLVKTHRR